MRRLVLLIVIAAAAALGGRELVDAGGAGVGDGAVVKVQRVVDGDTIVLAGGERVRYIGVDTPESVKPGTPVQCFAKAAARENARLVAGRSVRLRFDVEHRDRYGRLLAYVYRDGVFVNEALVRRGFATTLTIPPNVAHAEDFRRAAREARRAGRGLWRAC